MAVANVTPAAGIQPKKASELKGRGGVNMVIFGPGGVGKTTMLATAQDTPNGGPVLLVDADLGATSVTDTDMDVLQPTEWKTNKPGEMGLYTIIQRIKAQGPDVAKYKTYGFDSITAIYAMILKDILKTSAVPDMPSQPEYGKANTALIQLLQDMRALSKDTGKHVVFICHSKEVESEGGITLTRLALTPGVTTELTRIVDHIGFLTQDLKSGNRKLVFKPNPRLTAKFRQPKTGPQLPLELLNPSMATIIDHAQKAKEG
jgi:hypothetical protein